MLRHRWDISPAEAMALQRRLAERVRIEPLQREVRTVAGADCAFVDEGWRGGWRAWRSSSRVRVIAAAVLCDAVSLEVLAARHVIQPCRFPYVPGLLSFREAPAVIAAVQALPVRPDLLLCDGQGRAHPRRLGLASHVGLWLDIPTIGVAKSRLCGRHGQVGRRRGCRRSLRADDECIGAVVRTRSGVKPLYVSVGQRITLAECIRWTLHCARRFRQPEPTRRAHLLVSSLKHARAAADP